MKKRVFSAILAAAMIIMVLPIISLPVSAAISVGGYDWNFSAADGLFTVLANGVTAANAANGSDCAFTTGDIEKVVSTNAVTVIDKNAFDSCSNLKTINMPNATTIGAYAFNDCSTLVNVTFGTTMPPTFGENAFSSQILNVTVPAEADVEAWKDALVNAGANSATTVTVQPLAISGGKVGTDYTYKDGVVTVIKNGANLTIKNTNGTTSSVPDRIEVNAGISATITLDGVNIDVSSNQYSAAFQIADNSEGNVTVILADDSNNTLISGKQCAGLQKNGAYSADLGTLIIKGEENGTGKLTSNGYSKDYAVDGAGIGGGNGKSAGNIEIKDGVINVTSERGADWVVLSRQDAQVQIVQG